MRVTIDIADELLERAKREGRTLGELVEEGLRAVLDEVPARRPRDFDLPVSANTGGTLPGVDLTNNAALLDLMEEPRSSPEND